MSEEFCWSLDKDDIVVPEQAPIALHWNPSGNLVIRQEQWPDDDSLIIVDRRNIATLVAAIVAKAGLAGPLPGASPQPLTSAERSRRYRERHPNDGAQQTTRDGEREAASRPPLLLAAE